MKPSLLDLICCPMDGAWPLSLTRYDGPCRAAQNDDEVRHGALRCPHCSASFPVVDGIPSLLPTDDFYRKNRPWADQTGERLKRDQEAPTCERSLSPHLTALERALTLTALQPRPQDTLLEVGAGTGRLTASLMGRCCAVVACDLSLDSLRLLVRRARATEGNSRRNHTVVHAVQADACFMPFRADVFAKSLAGEVLQHLPGEAAQRQGLRQLARSVRPGGAVAISVYNYRQTLGSSRDPERRVEREGFHWGRAVYYRRFEPHELVQLVEPLFRVERAWGFYVARLDALGPMGLMLNHVLARTKWGLRRGRYLLLRCTVAQQGDAAARKDV